MINLNKALDEFFKLEREIYEHFGYEQQWRAFPIDDCREYFWGIDEHETEVTYSSNETFKDENVLYSANIQGDIYRKDDFTMIAVDTQADGNVFCQIFDNKKERKIPEGI